jgi:hypothetical protein
MIRTFIAVAVTAAVISPLAAHAAGQKRHKHHAYHRSQMSHMPVSMPQRVGPAWAGPNDCFTDEGYGRYAPCSGRSSQ